MQAAIDPDHGFAFARQRVRLIVRQSFGVRQALRNLFIVVEILDVGGRAEIIAIYWRPAFLGGPDIHQLHAIGFSGEFVPIGIQLGVIGDLVIVAQIESERFLRGGNPGRSARPESRRRKPLWPPMRGGASIVTSWVRVYYGGA